jgi:ABC-type transport system involved in multi-copper enzyme maturation permease subunit
MFMTLYLKEWKEKAGILLFGIGLLALFFGVEIGLAKNAEVREPVMGVVLVFFFPVMALLLGAGGFEPESHNDAWAYLFSRPVGKGTIWAAKYVSLLSQLAGLCLLFLAGMISVPGLKALAVGFRLPVVFGTELNFLPWSLLVSLFFFSIAFSLSPFSKRWINLFFGAFFIGLVLAFIAYEASTLVTVLLPDQWLDQEKWLHAFRWSLILMSGASMLASLLTFTREDFSQPRKKIGRFAGYAAPFAAVALLVAAAWTALLPRAGDRFIDMIGRSAGAAYFQTEKGIFAYDWKSRDVRRLAKGRVSFFGTTPIRDGKIVFTAVDISLERYKPKVLWSMNTDGSHKVRLVGGGFAPGDPRSCLNPYMFILSPDGKQVVFFDEGGIYGGPSKGSPLWVINVDGSGLRNLPVPREMANEERHQYWLSFVVWPAADPYRFLINQRGYGPEGRSRVWLYDLRDSSFRVLLDEFRWYWASSVPSAEDRFIVATKSSPDAPWRTKIFDFGPGAEKISEPSEIEIPGWRFVFMNRAAWSHDGDRLAFIACRGTTPGTGNFAFVVISVKERSILAQKELAASEKLAQSYSLDWLNGDTGIVLCDPLERALRILRPDLSEEKQIKFPTSAGSLYGPWVLGDEVLILDFDKNRLWHLNLKTERWKRIY